MILLYWNCLFFFFPFWIFCCLVTSFKSLPVTVFPSVQACSVLPTDRFCWDRGFAFSSSYSRNRHYGDIFHIQIIGKSNDNLIEKIQKRNISSYICQSSDSGLFKIHSEFSNLITNDESEHSWMRNEIKKSVFSCIGIFLVGTSVNLFYKLLHRILL